MTSTHSGSALVAKVSGVPQAAQKRRVAGGDERSTAGVPCVSRTAVVGYVAHGTAGAPAVRRHIEQWQYETSRGAPVTS